MTSINPMEILAERIKSRDLATLDPTERADLVNTFFFYALGLEKPGDFLSQPLYWDLICYATNLLGAYAIGIGDEELTSLMKVVTKRIYSLHYSVEDSNKMLGPDRETHTNLWTSRTEDLYVEE